MKKFFDPSMLRFLLVGVVNTLVGAGIMFLLYNLAGCSYWLSSAANYIVGGVVSYFLKSITPSKTPSARGSRFSASR